MEEIQKVMNFSRWEAEHAFYSSFEGVTPFEGFQKVRSLLIGLSKFAADLQKREDEKEKEEDENEAPPLLPLRVNPKLTVLCLVRPY